jgi:PAS domain S-box-containing protein
MAIEDLNDIVVVAASGQAIEEATHGIDHLALLGATEESSAPRVELDVRWRRMDGALKTLQGTVTSRRGQTALVSLERLVRSLRERVALVLSEANQGEKVRFTKDIEAITGITQYIATECSTLIRDDLSYFSQVQATIRNRTAETALIIIVSVVAVLVLSLVGQAVVFSARLREMRENQAQRDRLMEALAAKGQDLERQIEERTRAEEALRQSEAHIASLFDSLHDAVVATDRHGIITRVNPVARGWLGQADPGEAGVEARPDVGELLRLRGRDLPVETAEMVRSVLDHGAPYVSSTPLFLIRKDQSDLPVSASISAIRGQTGDLVGCVIVLRDVSQALAMQERTQHAAKMEAVGQLAGGVAHDFNNLLTGINGYAEMVLSGLDPGSPEADYTRQIQQIGGRAAEMVSHLLGFARRGKVQIVAVDLHAIIDEVVALLQHSVDKRIVLRRDLAAGNPWVTGDPTQLQNAILNLALNARDAMPDGGELVLATRSELFGGAEGITIEVRDTGHGIPPEIRDRIFEPFFTTKEQGKGTGLGLAAVYGCVQSHNGEVQVESSPGHGTLFRIHLAVTEQRSDVVQPHAVPMGEAGPRGPALVVDDEEIVRSVVARNLTKLGFQVLSTGDPHQALAWTAERIGKLDLVLLDMTMPKMSGAELFHLIRAKDPRVRILLVSGYALNPEVPPLLESGRARFLPKPFQLEDLARELNLLFARTPAA